MNPWDDDDEDDFGEDPENDWGDLRIQGILEELGYSPEFVDGNFIIRVKRDDERLKVFVGGSTDIAFGLACRHIWCFVPRDAEEYLWDYGLGFVAVLPGSWFAWPEDPEDEDCPHSIGLRVFVGEYADADDIGSAINFVADAISQAVTDYDEWKDNETELDDGNPF